MTFGISLYYERYGDESGGGVFFANDRCDHENDIEQLKNGVQALRMPSDDLVSNWRICGCSLGVNLKVGGVMDAQQRVREADCPYGV